MKRWTVVVCFALIFCGLSCPHTLFQTSQSSKPAAEDGWVVGSPDSVGLSAAPMEAMEKAIRAGEFKKIGSVLVARHGKLVYEGYFDGDASALRDTRSATKSITDVLVGIAIGAKKLSGLDARVLALLPERARKLQNPARARTRSRWKTCSP